MAQIALPRQQVTQAPQSTNVGSPLYQRRRNSNAGPIELVPNPDFVFPQRRPDTQSPDSECSSQAHPMSLQAYPAGRRGSTPGRRQKSVNALPDFSFNPASADNSSVSSPLTPPLSPSVSTTPTTPSRPIGHRRGGSEFIGGDGRSGGAALLSSSPTKGDGVLPPPSTSLRPGPSAGRRGHAHRRSGAISSHDLSSIIRPADVKAPTRADSAPVTPMDGDQFAFGHSVNKSISQPSLRDTSFFADDPDASSMRPPSRARVGFSDKVEYIRPLSTISSETETSLSTVRGHSATGSISSVISAGTSSPPSVRMSRPSLNTTFENEGRPSTAGAVLDKQKSSPFSGDFFNRKRPMSAVSPASPIPAIVSPVSPRVPTKRRGFFRLESRRNDNLETSFPTSASDASLSASLDSLPSPMLDEDEAPDEAEKSKSASKKGNRKPRKVKSWANSIISRKGKHGSKTKGRAPTPPPEPVSDGEDTDGSDEMDFEANFDVDNTVTIVSPAEDTSTEPKLETDIASWRPRELKRIDSDSMSPVIDLDAALGPFNTPHGSSPRGQQRGFGAHRRAMHSAGGLMQNHRRTESAPELVPFELRNSAVATANTMADVFEEEEPDEDASDSKPTGMPPTVIEERIEEDVEEPKIQVVEADHSQNGASITWNFSDGLGIKRRDKQSKPEFSEAISPQHTSKSASVVPMGNGSKQSLNVSPLEVVEDYEEPRTSSLTHSSDSTVTAQGTTDETKDTEQVMNFSLPLPQQSLMTPDTLASSFSSPDFRSSQASFDTPRLGTSASSVTDYRAMPSPHFGEPGPELRISVDDVPSLTSSRSTMTSAMHNAFPMMSPRAIGDRSASLCSIPSVESRRRKRSSIASLSRLINGSSFAEKSKLSIEQRPHSEYLEPSKESKKKHKRLSKLMQFWKPKETPKA
ncbi:hypothetical protein CC78DRAFT_239939 [Lojkania enalia]|uniref:Cell wall proline rich protein n=1 Tax=Lojkania enalia TaxID=147567 RepID=A0A9P4NAT1_9PLEO|nr:hypothetical protein CC78DRAFT_239939 [Didymosphaeria enalia]